MDLSIITVNTNDKEKLIPQIQSLVFGGEGISYEQIISDNGSTDGSVEEIKNSFPEVIVVENGKNVGFGSANNSGFVKASGNFLLLLNPDMRVESGSLKKIVDWMQAHPDVGIVSPKLIREDGTLQQSALPRRFPGLIDQVAIILKLPHIFPSLLNRYLYKGFDSEKEQDVDSVRGSFMLMRREIADRLGWVFDPRYFIWFEDVDTCREVQKLGYRVVYTPIISCVDYVGQTFKRQPSVQKQKWFTASMIKYFQKWEAPLKTLILRLVRPIGLALTWLHSKLT